MKKPEYVLDSYALVAYLQDEAIADQVETLLDQAAEKCVTIHVSLVNLGEVAYLVERRYGTTCCAKVIDELRAFPIEFEQVTLDRVLSAAHVKAHHAISYADAFAVALAQELGAIVVTGDPEFKQVESSTNVLWL